MLKFEKNDYTIEEVTLCGETIRFRAFRDLIYVEKPVNEEFQKMNLLCRNAIMRSIPAWL